MSEKDFVPRNGLQRTLGLWRNGASRNKIELLLFICLYLIILLLLFEYLMTFHQMCYR
jgi:hypothetical protein